MNQASSDTTTRVGEWILDAEHNELRRGGEVLRLEPKAIEVLGQLAQRAGRVVSREELLAAVWPGLVVGDDALTQAIIKLRKALGDDAHRPKYIETISKRGYRLIAPVAPVAEGATAPASAPRGRRRAVMVGFALVLGGLLAAYMATRHATMPWPIGEDTRGRPGIVQPVIAVLPLSNASDDPRKDYFSDGVTEDIIGTLGRFSGLRVMSRNAIQPYKNKDVPLATIRQELGARYVVRGSVRETGGKLRVSVELSDADKGVLLWSDKYEGAGPELFAIQDRVVRDIAAALNVKVTQLEQQRLESRPAESLQAHDLLLRARAHLAQVDRGANRQARQLLEQALALAPDYAEVVLYMGEAEIQRALYGWVEDPAIQMQRAEQYAKLVLASPATRSHSRAELLLAKYHSNMGRPEQAKMHADRALAANPADADALLWKGVSLLYVGRIEEAIAAMEEARRFDPQMNAATGVNLVMGYYQADRYRDAITLADILLAGQPRDVSLHALKAAAYVQLGDEIKAREAAEQVRRFNPYYEVRYSAQRFLKIEHKDKFRHALQKAGL